MTTCTVYTYVRMHMHGYAYSLVLICTCTRCLRECQWHNAQHPPTHVRTHTQVCGLRMIIIIAKTLLGTSHFALLNTSQTTLGQFAHLKCTTASIIDSSAQAYQSHINLIVVIQFPISPPCTTVTSSNTQRSPSMSSSSLRLSTRTRSSISPGLGTTAAGSLLLCFILSCAESSLRDSEVKRHS